MRQLCDDENVAIQFPMLLHDFMINNFSLLGLEPKLLTEINKDIDRLFRSIKKGCELIYKYTRIDNDNVAKNLIFMIDPSISKDIKVSVPGWFEWFMNKIEDENLIIKTYDLLDERKLNDLEKKLHYEYLNTTLKIIYKLFSIL